MATAIIERRRIDGELTVPWPHAGQQRMLDRILCHTGEQTMFYHGICGRGWGKTTVAIDAAQALLNRGPRQKGIVYEPDWDTIYDTFLESWIEMVPPKRYRIHQKTSTIYWHNGATLKYRPRAITGAKDRIKNKSRGRNLTFVIDDEAALGFEREQFTNTLLGLRSPVPIGGRVYVFITTPKPGAYINLSREPGHIVINHPSMENPGLSPEIIEQWRSTMSPAMFEREVLAMVKALSGKIWDMVDVSQPWPYGNLDTTFKQFDPSLPFYLGCDIGSATGAYIILQKPPKRWGDRADRWVIVGELCPASDGNVRRCMELIKLQFGTPSGVAVGIDVNTRGAGDGATPAYFIEKVFGNVPIHACDEHVFGKQLQYDVTSSLFLAGTDNRRLTIAENYIRLDRDSRRGIPEMFEEDVWLEPDKRRPGDVLPKNKEILVQHARDALMMGITAIAKPPIWAKEPAA